MVRPASPTTSNPSSMSWHAAIVLVPHLPGYGKTRRDAAPCSLDRIIARLEDRITRSRVSEAAVVGFSWGAYRAVAIAPPRSGKRSSARAPRTGPRAGAWGAQSRSRGQAEPQDSPRPTSN
jgi:pimeloyl-ACP methyl ester carboxylesterase